LRVTVIGGGTMGSGIAEVFAQFGHDAILSDISDSILRKSELAINASLKKLSEKGIIKEPERVSERILYDTNFTAYDSEFYVEAVIEKPEIKSEVLHKIKNQNAIVATNTSSISITMLSKYAPNPKKFIGMHFFNPPVIMKLIEVVSGYDTDGDTIKRVMDISKSLGKTPVMVKDFPGFISNRVLMALIREAIISLEEGISDAAGIDTIMKLGMNHPMGPLELSDFIGNDVVYDILNVLYNDLGYERFKPPVTLRNMVYAGKLGRKTGEGFYKYDK